MGFLRFPLHGGGELYLEVDDEMGDHVANGADDLGLRAEALRLAVDALRRVSPESLGSIADLLAESGIMSSHRPQLESPQVLDKAHSLLNSAGHLDNRIDEVVLVADIYWHIRGVNQAGPFSLHADKSGRIYYLSVDPAPEEDGPESLHST
ncbi:hypothetical protein OHO28_38775 [Streptomyces europaeiscabiei]|uniref:hypothetical protein n=1 Tax=Streptomyces europaeiscabiei TaxID=146819 RepID=UPI002E17553F